MRYKYYVAIHNKNYKYAHVDIIRIDSTIKPTAKAFPQYAFMWGGYKTRREALKVAMYQNYMIDSPEPYNGNKIKPTMIVYPV